MLFQRQVSVPALCVLQERQESKKNSFCDDRTRVWYGKYAVQLNVAKLVLKTRRRAIRTSFYYLFGYHFRLILSPGTFIGNSHIQPLFLVRSQRAGTFLEELIVTNAPGSRTGFI